MDLHKKKTRIFRANKSWKFYTTTLVVLVACSMSAPKRKQIVNKFHSLLSSHLFSIVIITLTVIVSADSTVKISIFWAQPCLSQCTAMLPCHDGALELGYFFQFS